MERGHVDLFVSRTYIQFAPKLFRGPVRIAMRNPVAHVTWQLRIGDCRMIRIGNEIGLRADVGPGAFQPIIGCAKPSTTRIFPQHLNTPSQRRSQPESSLMIEPAVI